MNSREPHPFFHKACMLCCFEGCHRAQHYTAVIKHHLTSAHPTGGVPQALTTDNRLPAKATRHAGKDGSQLSHIVSWQVHPADVSMQCLGLMLAKEHGGRLQLSARPRRRLVAASSLMLIIATAATVAVSNNGLAWQFFPEHVAAVQPFMARHMDTHAQAGGFHPPPHFHPSSGQEVTAR